MSLHGLNVSDAGDRPPISRATVLRPRRRCCILRLIDGGSRPRRRVFIYSNPDCHRDPGRLVFNQLLCRPLPCSCRWNGEVGCTDAGARSVDSPDRVRRLVIEHDVTDNKATPAVGREDDLIRLRSGETRRCRRAT